MRYRTIAMAALAFVALAAVPTSASALRDTPTFLMAKGLNLTQASYIKNWNRRDLRCSKRWHPSGESYWLGKCSIHVNRHGRHGSTRYRGYGSVSLRQYFNIHLWSVEYDIRIARPVTPSDWRKYRRDKRRHNEWCEREVARGAICEAPITTETPEPPKPHKPRSPIRERVKRLGVTTEWPINLH